MKTKVGINALYINWGVNAGTETYFTNIVEPWYEGEDDAVEFILYCRAEPPWWKGNRSHFRIKRFSCVNFLPLRIISEQLLIPILAKRNVDVVFSPGYVGILLLGKKQVITIHDAFAWKFPAEIGFVRSVYWRLFVPLTAKVASRIIAVSNNTARDIVQHCGISKDKIVTIYEGGDHLLKVKPESKILSKYSLLTNGYFHTVGVFKRIKNPLRILEAFEMYQNEVGVSAAKRLLLIGHAGSKFAKEMLLRAQDIPNTLYVGRVSDGELAAIYSNSAGLIFPSLYEGFGIPILEAESFNCPVVTSKVSSMAEISDKSALFVNPESVIEIANSMILLHKNSYKKKIKGNLKLNWDVASKETKKYITSSFE